MEKQELYKISKRPRSSKKAESGQVYALLNISGREVNGVYIGPGTQGGLIEHPELIDTTQNIWISSNAKVFGKTLITGETIISNAVIKDCEIENATIGDAEMEGEVRIVNTQIKGNDNVILDNAYIKDSEIDSCYICDSPHIIESTLKDTEVSGKAFVTKVTANDCQLSDSAMASHSTMTGKNLHDNDIACGISA